MPTHADHVPKGLGDLGKRIRKLEKEINELRGAKRLQNSTVAGGKLIISDAGEFHCHHPNGQVVHYVGQLNNGDYGTNMFRSDDGSQAFSVGGGDTSSGAEAGVVAMWSRAGGKIASDDAYNGQYLGMPFIPIPLYNVNDTSATGNPQKVPTTSTWMYEGGFFQMHAYIAIALLVQCVGTGSSISGTIQVQNGATSSWTTLQSWSHTGPDTGGWVAIGPWRLAPKLGYTAYGNLLVTATAGSSGTAYLTPLYAVGTWSESATEGQNS